MQDFESFYREHVRLVMAMARARMIDAEQVEDLTQETFLRAWRHAAEFAGMDPAARRAWLVRTVRNLATDAWRRQTVEAAAAEPDPVATSDGPTELRLDVEHALAQLSPEDRELVTLRYLEDMNSREIGEVLGTPEGTVRRRLSACRERLAQGLAQWAPEGVR